MTGWYPASYGPLFFHFGIKPDDPPEGPPLACLNGGIMVDSGSEGRGYLLTCQDRFPLYAALAGMRTLLFVRDAEHVSHYRKRISEVEQHMGTICNSTGTLLDFDLPEPLFLPCDINSSEVCILPDSLFLERLQNPRIVDSHVRGGIYLNQLSPTISNLIAQFYDVLQEHGIECNARLDEYQRMATCALQWHDKASYVKLLKDHDGADPLPLHVPTAMFSSGLLEDMSWEAFEDIFRKQTGSTTNVHELFVKSGMDAAGEVSVILNRENFYQKKKVLLVEISTKVSEMKRAQRDVQLLVQPRIERFSGTDGLPTSVGITCNICDDHQIQRSIIAGHVYEDPERKTFIGSYQSDLLTGHFLSTVGEKKILELFRLLAHQGYRGPIHFDAVRNSRSEYVFIYDCNPRLGGSFPGLILKRVLEREGLHARTVLTLGYRGRIVYPDIEAKIAELDGLKLLYTRDSQKGILPIPSLVRSDSFDLILINMEMNEIRCFIDSGHIMTLSDEDQCDLGGVYL